jgi:hypothetical protein
MDNDKQRNVNLMDLIILLLKHKGLILSFVLLGAVASSTYGIVHYSNHAIMTNPLCSSGLYYSECTIEPDDVYAAKMKNTIMGHDITRRLIEADPSFSIIPDVLLGDAAKTGKPADRMDPNAVHHQLSRQLMVKMENTQIKLTFISPSSESTSRMIQFYLLAVSDVFREKTLQNVESKRKALQKHLLYETDPVLKAKLSDRIIQLIEIEKIARDSTFYGFDVIDPPSPPRMLSDTQMIPGKTKLNYVVIVLLCMLASFLLAVFLAFCIEKIRKAKREDPERFEQIKKYLHLRVK